MKRRECCEEGAGVEECAVMMLLRKTRRRRVRKRGIERAGRGALEGLVCATGQAEREAASAISCWRDRDKTQERARRD